MERALVLSSGGVDSTTCIGLAIERFGKDNVSTVSVSYGQKHSKELDCAQNIADYYELEHYELDLSQIMRYSNCSLLSHSTEDIDSGTYEEQIEASSNGKVSTYVPFRNGLMLSSVAALAMSIYPNDITHVYLGAHADDATANAYADTSKAFTDAMTLAIDEGTYHQVKVEAPLVEMNKAQVVKEGLRLEVPYSKTWSCYAGEEKPCGKCGTCIDAIEAFKINNIDYLSLF
ncbi:MAG: 7-cyano-7-deazaguanine synthase QueC [Acholeplasmatales bacterium]|nr:7-cyano-7-deazaguanine synthase QueC [Acholeplasmatales bacterium]